MNRQHFTPGCTVFLASLAMLATPHVHAAERSSGWEFGIDLLYQDEQSSEFEGGSTVDMDDDLGFSIAGGYRFNARLEVGFALDWQTVDYGATLRSPTVSTAIANVRGDLEAFTPRILATFNFLEAPLTPFVTGSLGWTFVDTNIPDAPPQTVCWHDPWWGTLCNTYQSTRTFDEPAYSLGVGARWDFSAGYTLRLAYERRWVDYEQATSVPQFDQLQLGFMLRY